jgi:hypothetical protein
MGLRDLEEDMIEEWPVLQLDREGDTIEGWVHHQALEEGMMDLLMVATREVLLAGVMVNLMVAMREDHLTAMWVEEEEEGTILKMGLHLLELGMIIDQDPVKHVTHRWRF